MIINSQFFNCLRIPASSTSTCFSSGCGVAAHSCRRCCPLPSAYYLKKNNIKTHARLKYTANVINKTLIRINVDKKIFTITDNDENEIFLEKYYGMGRGALLYEGKYILYNGSDIDNNSPFKNESFKILLDFVIVSF